MWDLGRRAARALYESAIEPALLYAAPIFLPACREWQRAQLLSAMRPCALGATAAYNTAPTKVVHMLAHIIPADLRAAKLEARFTASHFPETFAHMFPGCDGLEGGTALDRMHPSDLPALLLWDLTSANDVQIFMDGARSEHGAAGACVVFANDMQIA